MVQTATFGCVTDPTTLKTSFAQRLLELCVDKGLPEHGRQTQLAKQFRVSQQAAGKWLTGRSWPSTETLAEMADWGAVNINWLWQGVGPKRGTRVDAKALVLDEAVHLLPPELGTDLIDNLRAKLVRVGKLKVSEPDGRYAVMLDAYEKDIARRRPS